MSGDKIGSDATITEEEASARAFWKRRCFVANRTAAMGRHSEKNLSFLELPSRSEELCSLPPGLARVSPAHFGRRQSARRGRRGRRGAYYNEKYLLECSSSAGDILLGALCQYILEFWKHGRHILPRSHRALQGWKRRAPPRGSSRVVHMGNADPGIPATWALEHGRLLVMDGYLLLQTRVTVHHPDRRHPDSCAWKQLPSSSAPLPRGPTTDVQNMCSQRHGRVVLSLVRELALDSSSPRPRKPPRNVHSTSTIKTSWSCGTE